MKKLLLLPLVAVALILSAAPADALSWADREDNGVKIKVEICHWANGNVSTPTPSEHSVQTTLDTGHGILTLNAQTGGFVSFVAHTGTGGHEQDTIKRVYLKKGNDEFNLYVAPNGCLPVIPPPLPVSVSVCLNGNVTVFGPGLKATVDAQVAAFLASNPGATIKDGDCPVPVTTTTTTKTVIVEVPVEKIVEVPVPGPTMVIERTVTVPAPAAPPAPAPAQELPRTGSGTLLTLLGAGLTGSGLILRRLFR